MSARFGILLTILWSLNHVFAVENATCEFSALEQQKLLNLDYEKFDQTVPDGGWRILARSCPRLAANLIETYKKTNRMKLKPNEIHVLNFHIGQQYAKIGETDLALSNFKDS